MSARTATILLACIVIFLVAVLAGMGAAYLARRDQATYSTALGHAAIAFTATLTLAAAITTALAEVVQ
jgi:uncharacterized membrane protein (DUF441 family)